HLQECRATDRRRVPAPADSELEHRSTRRLWHFLRPGLRFARRSKQLFPVWHRECLSGGSVPVDAPAGRPSSTLDRPSSPYHRYRRSESEASANLSMELRGRAITRRQPEPLFHLHWCGWTQAAAYEYFDESQSELPIP